MAGMQEEFISRVRNQHKATRPHVNYVKEFERRAKDDPKECAEEAQREIVGGATMLQRAFKEAFGTDFERAFEETFYPTSDQQHAIKETAPLPDHPVAREFFLLWLYWLHFHRITLGYFLRRLQAPGESDEERTRAICNCFVRHQLASWCAYLIVADDIAKQFPEQAIGQLMVEQFTAFFVIHTSLNTNKRLRKVIDELRDPDESRFERLIKEVSGEVLSVWRERRAAWSKEEVSQDHLMQMRTEVAARLEQRPKSSQETELAAFADREKMLKHAKDAQLSAQELEVFELYVANPKLKYREIAERLEISTNQVGVIKHRIKNKLAAGF